MPATIRFSSSLGPYLVPTILRATCLTFCVGLTCLCTAVLEGQQRPSPATGWRQYTSKEGRFRVEMPAAPTTDRATMRTPYGELPLHTANVAGHTTGYVVFYSDYPERVVRRFTAEQILRGARDAAVRRLGGRLLEESSTRVSGQPARRLEIEISGGGAIARTTLILAGRRLYQVTVAAPPEQVRSAEAERFINSFRILP